MKTIFLLGTLLFTGGIYTQEAITTTNVVKDSQGKITKLDFIQDGVNKTATYEYNADGARTLSQIAGVSGKIFEATTAFNETKDVTQIWYKSGKPDTKLVYKFNDDGRLNQIYDYYKDTNDYFFTEYTYAGAAIASAKSYFVLDGQQTGVQDLDKLIR